MYFFLALTSPQTSETASTSTAAPVAVTIANQSQLDQTIVSVNDQQATHVVTQQGNTDGSTSLSIAHVQTLQGHQLIGNLNQVSLFVSLIFFNFLEVQKKKGHSH